MADEISFVSAVGVCCIRPPVQAPLRQIIGNLFSGKAEKGSYKCDVAFKNIFLFYSCKASEARPPKEAMNNRFSIVIGLMGSGNYTAAIFCGIYKRVDSQVVWQLFRLKVCAFWRSFGHRFFL